MIKDIVEHLATCKKPLDVNITLHWKFHALDLPSPFKDAEHGKPEPVLREQIMPSAAAFDAFVQELQGRAKDQPFSLQFMASCGSRDRQAKRLLQATYRPDLGPKQGISSSSDSEDSPATTYQIHQVNIDRLKETLSQPDPNAAERPAPEGAPEARRARLFDLHRRLGQRRARGEVLTLEMVQREMGQIMPVDWQGHNQVLGDGDGPEEDDEGADDNADDRRDPDVGLLGAVRAHWLAAMDDDLFD